jgi:DNA-binding protein H-NS
MEAQIERLKREKQEGERSALKDRLAQEAKKAGFDINELFGSRGRGPRKGVRVMPKYRDPDNPQNTWTGRGRMPRWMETATKGGKRKKEDFLI